MTHNTGGPLPCPRCGGKSLHYANCPLAGDETYALSGNIRPETTMIERVARAICRNAGADPDASASEMDQWSRLWTRYTPQARAAIAAMREPTEGMTEIGDDSWGSMPNAEGIWNAMIDAALEEG